MDLEIQNREQAMAVLAKLAVSPEAADLGGDDDSAAAPVGGRAKRLMDISFATAFLLCFWPLMLLVALMIKLSDGGPVFFSHGRVGRNRAMFPCLKFRTMAVDSAELLRRHLAENPAALEEWQLTQKLKVDPRITAVGLVLRKTSLDELPQIINILRGEMSIVGPRPVVTDEIRRYGADAMFYLRARPGLTGPWQVSGRNDVSYEARVAFDRRYVESWSLLTDVSIILRTVPAVIFARGY